MGKFYIDRSNGGLCGGFLTVHFRSMRKAYIPNLESIKLTVTKDKPIK
jgi:hypothetical protein